MSETIPDRAPGGEILPMTEMTGPEELVGSAGRIKVNTADVAQWEAQGYTRVTADTPLATPSDGGSDEGEDGG